MDRPLPPRFLQEITNLVLVSSICSSLYISLNKNIQDTTFGTDLKNLGHEYFVSSFFFFLKLACSEIYSRWSIHHYSKKKNGGPDEIA